MRLAYGHFKQAGGQQELLPRTLTRAQVNGELPYVLGGSGQS
jgi:hypothetical protein